MLLLFFLAGWLAPAERASLVCSNVATAQTESVRGQAGRTAVVKVSSEDDHDKNTHLCMADYQLLIKRNSEAESLAVNIFSSDAEWGQSLSILLDGFSQDGNKVFGVTSEGGNAPTEQLFDYNLVDETVSLLDLGKQRAHVTPTKCPTTASVIGTTQGGSAVVELTSGDHCLRGGRWLFNSVKGRLRRLAPGAAFVDLYKDAP